MELLGFVHVVGSSNVNQKLQVKKLEEKREGAIPMLLLPSTTIRVCRSKALSITG